jgi:hypothetical protein
MISGQKHIYRYAQSRIIILSQNVSVTTLTIIRVSYNKNSINIQIIVEKCMMKPLHVTLFYSAQYGNNIYKSEGSWFDPRWCHGIFH